MKNEIELELKTKISELTPVSYDAHGGFAGSNYSIKVDLNEFNFFYFILLDSNLIRIDSYWRWKIHNCKFNEIS